jgi:hypothetical protein
MLYACSIVHVVLPGRMQVDLPNLVSALPFNSEADYRSYINKLKAIPAQACRDCTQTHNALALIPHLQRVLSDLTSPTPWTICADGREHIAAEPGHSRGPRASQGDHARRPRYALSW